MDEQTLRERALARDPEALRALVDALAPVVHVRVARALERWQSSRGRGRDRRQEIQDIMQEVFVAIFASEARALRSWDPDRGLSLASYVGLIAEHQVASILRSGKRNPWMEEPMLDPEPALPKDAGPESQVIARHLFATVLDRIRAELTPRGLELFYALMIDEQSVESVSARTGMKPDALFAWRSRLARRARELAGEIERVPRPAATPRLRSEEGRS
jgi:RNA polymerase sigma-70 factor (ECF subfamily)